MFDRFIRFAEARRALARGHFDQVLQLLQDPVVRDQRRARELRDKALQGLMQRARRRQGEGARTAALADLSRVLVSAPEYDGARTLAQAVKDEIEGASTTAREAGSMLREARRMAARGELDAAAEQCRAAHELHALPAEERAVSSLIEARRKAGADLAEQAEAALRDGETDRARDLLVRAKGQDGGLAAAGDLGLRIARAVAAALVPALREQVAKGDIDRALEQLHRERAQLPELDAVDSVQKLMARAAGSWSDELRKRLKAGELDAAAAAYAEMDPRVLQETGGTDMRRAMDALAQALELRDRGDFDGAGRQLAVVMQGSGVALPRAVQKELDRAAADTRDGLAKARELAGAGRLVEARAALVPLLERWPMHEAARREMDLLDQGAKDREERLARARELAKDARLREAAAIAVALVGPSGQGEEARLLLADLRARIDLVDSGLDQVRRAMHGRDSATPEGLRHCRSRLQQLMAVQTDNEAAAELDRALEAEIEGLELFSKATALMDGADAKGVATALADWPDVRGRLLRPDRLDARVLELGDRMLTAAEAAAGAGQLAAAVLWLSATEALAGEGSELARRAQTLRERVEEQRATASDAARRGAEALAGRDLEAAERHLEEARGASVDGSSVRRLEDGVVRLRQQEAALCEVERLAEGRDFDAAQAKLSGMPPTPPLLRTRVFDIKQSLARAQGLEAGFLLRVDEGGEFLVLRRDSCTIGNLRDGHADLAVLANIAGSHARIQRSMSFHGGLQDRIVADRGEITVGGRAVAEHKLKTGDRVRLGKALELHYRLPSSRSLSALLTLSSGFQVAGTDKVLLMKDRGRDGRILIGPVDDAHVRTPHDQPEVELFATKDGQVRVRYDGQGEINGRPFAKEHPVEAGALVTCGEVSFVLQPWQRGA